MSLDKLEKRIKKSKSKTITWDKEELKKALNQKFAQGIYEEKRWHIETPKDFEGKTEATIQQDEWYENHLTEGTELVVYDLDDATGNRKNVLESMMGMRVSRTGETIFDLNKYLTKEQLRLIQDAAYVKAHIDPLAVSAITNLVNFIIGRGVEIDCIVPEIELEINKIRKFNDFTELEKQMVKHTLLAGEFFVKIREKKNGIFISGVSPSNVIEVEYDPENPSLTFAYKIIPAMEWETDANFFNYDSTKGRWYPSIKISDYEKSFTIQNRNEFVKNEYIYFIKSGNYDEVRGNPPFRAALKPLRLAEDFTMDRMRLNHERSKVIMIKTVSSAGIHNASYKPQQLPRGGVILVADENTKYEFLDSNIDAGDAKEDGMWILHTVGAPLVLPPNILQQRADQAVYASMKKMDTAFSQNIINWQIFFENKWNDLYKFLIKRLVDKGVLKKQYKVPAFVGLSSINSKEASLLFQDIHLRVSEMLSNGSSVQEVEKEVKKKLKDEKLDKEVEVNSEDIPIDMIFPDVIRDNPLEMAKVLFLHRKMGLTSLATAARKAGYDWRVEMYQRMKEKEMGLDVDDLNDPTKEPNPTGDNDTDGDASIKM